MLFTTRRLSFKDIASVTESSSCNTPTVIFRATALSSCRQNLAAVATGLPARAAHSGVPPMHAAYRPAPLPSATISAPLPHVRHARHSPTSSTGTSPRQLEQADASSLQLTTDQGQLTNYNVLWNVSLTYASSTSPSLMSS